VSRGIDPLKLKKKYKAEREAQVKKFSTNRARIAQYVSEKMVSGVCI
jgi:hypothetical protein